MSFKSDEEIDGDLPLAARLKKRVRRVLDSRTTTLLSAALFVVPVSIALLVGWTVVASEGGSWALALRAAAVSALGAFLWGIPLVVYMKGIVVRFYLQRAALNAVDTSLLIYDRDFRVAQYNRAAREHHARHGGNMRTGMSELELIAQVAPSAASGGAEEAEAWARDRIARRRALLDSGEAAVRYDERSDRYDQVSLFELPGGHIVDMRTDVTALKRKEIELAAREVELERARDDAQASDRAKSEFLANMSHEIRTPMNGVIGMTELLLESELSEEQALYASTVSSSALALLSLINDILDFSKVEAGKLTLEREPFDLRAALDDVGALLATTAHGKGVELIINYSPDLPTRFIGDIGRIRQVVTNLVGNAVKFTEAGHVAMTLEGCVEGGEAILDFSVRDTGIGIPPSRQDQIFNVFEQVDGASNRRFEGTGLGLAIARRLVRLMGGDITLVSEEGVGSEFGFRITLPLAGGESIVHADPVSGDLAGASVLVVDDLALNREILSRRVASWGMRPILAASGVEALRIARAEHVEGGGIDIAIFDYQMPGMDGHELCRFFKGHSELRDIPILMLSSVDQSVQGSQVSELGFAGCLIKPVRTEALLELVHRTLAPGIARKGPQAPDTERTDVAGGASAAATADAVGADATVAGTAGSDVTEGEAAGAAKTARIGPDAPTDAATEVASTGAGTDIAGRIGVTNPNGMRILVVEDHPTNQMIMVGMLKPRGFELELAGDGQLGVEAYARTPPDLVLMDVSMPRMNGLDATRAIREHERDGGLRRCPIIALTANAMVGDRERCLEAGMDDFLSKPVRMKSLLEMIASRTGRDERDIAA